MKHHYLALLVVPALISCGTAYRAASIRTFTVDKLGVDVGVDENREYSYTDKKAGFWYGRTHQDSPTDWYAGWNQAKRRILSDYTLTVDGKVLTRKEAQVCVSRSAGTPLACRDGDFLDGGQPRVAQYHYG